MEQLLFERGEAAKILNVSIRLLDYYIAEGEIAARRFGRRVLISRSELERFSKRDHGGRVAKTHKSQKAGKSAGSNRETAAAAS